MEFLVVITGIAAIIILFTLVFTRLKNKSVKYSDDENNESDKD